MHPREGQGKNVFLKSHVVEVGNPFPEDRTVLTEHLLRRASLEGLGFDLDQFEVGATLDQNVGPEKQIFVADRRFVENYRFPLQQFPGLLYGLIVIQGFDLIPAGKVELGQLPDLETPFGQGGEEGVVLLVICVLRLSRVKQLCFTLLRQDEAGFGQVAG
jgi:hypothetical protein